MKQRGMQAISFNSMPVTLTWRCVPKECRSPPGLIPIAPHFVSVHFTIITECEETRPVAHWMKAARRRLQYHHSSPIGTSRECKGWKYRAKVLDQDLQIGAVKGVARVVQDELENTYNACFEEGGEKNYNYKP